MNMHVNKTSLNINPGIQLIERSDARIYLADTKQASFIRDGVDRRVFAWREQCLYTMKETVVSREYTFNGKDDWTVTSEAHL